MDRLTEDAKKYFSLTITPEQLSMFSLYEKTLLEWNQLMNLTAITTPDTIRIKHFLDSLSCVLAWNNAIPPQTLIDVGTGAGFPGLVLKIIFPSLKLTLVESINKKADFCRHMVGLFNFSDVEIVTDRSELLGQDKKYREQYDCAVARAVAPLPILSEYLLPFVRLGGMMIAMKGNHGSEEVVAGDFSIKALGGTISQQIPVLLPTESEPRMLVVVKKVKLTPSQYPREVGIPSQNPLMN